MNHRRQRRFAQRIDEVFQVQAGHRIPLDAQATLEEQAVRVFPLGGEQKESLQFANDAQVVFEAIRKRIASVRNTRKITRAMKLVAAAKLKGATDRALAAQPYQQKLRAVLSNVGSRVGEGVDLPGRGAHPADLAAITVDDEVASVVADTSATAPDGPVVVDGGAWMGGGMKLMQP